MKENIEEAIDVELQDYKFNPEIIKENNKEIIDYTKVECDKVYLVNNKDILTKPRPDWIPELDEEGLKADQFLPVTVHDNNGNYYVESKIKTGKTGNFETKLYKMRLDVLTATVDYYLKKERAYNKKNGINKKVSLPRSLKSMRAARYNSMKELVKLLPEYKAFTNRKEENFFIFIEQYQPLLQSLKDKKLDLNLQKQEYSNTHEKGEETSYGDINCTDELLEDFGIKIKKQNGKTFKDSEIDAVKNTVKEIYSYYGNLCDEAKKYGLKFSYADNCNQHARKAVGLFTPYYNAIGVSFFNSDSKVMSVNRMAPACIFTHEVAHWLDNLKGKESHNWFASDKTGTRENQIAEKYKKLIRKNLNKKNGISSGKNKLGEYWFRTCECFARAVEQNYAISQGIKINEEGYLPEEQYKEEIQPMVNQLLEENRKYFNLKDFSEKLNVEPQQSLFDFTQAEQAQSSGKEKLAIENATNFVLKKLKKAGIEVVTDKSQGLGEEFFEKEIHLNTDFLNSNIAVHEYTHLWDSYTQKTNPKLWQKGMDILKDTSVWNEIIEDENYEVIKGNDALVLSEVHARICGKLAQKFLERIAKEYGTDIEFSAEKWNKEVVEYVKMELFPGRTIYHKRYHTSGIKENEIDGDSIERFISTPMNDLVKGLSVKHRNFETRFMNGDFMELFEYISDINFKTHIYKTMPEKEQAVLYGKIWNELFSDGEPLEIKSKRKEWESSVAEYDKTFSSPELVASYTKQAKEVTTEKIEELLSTLKNNKDSFYPKTQEEADIINEKEFKSAILNKIAKHFSSYYNHYLNWDNVYIPSDTIISSYAESKTKMQVLEDELKKRKISVEKENKLMNKKENIETKTSAQEEKNILTQKELKNFYASKAEELKKMMKTTVQITKDNIKQLDIKIGTILKDNEGMYWRITDVNDFMAGMRVCDKDGNKIENFAGNAGRTAFGGGLSALLNDGVATYFIETEQPEIKEEKNYNFFVKDSAEFEQFAKFEPITNLTAEEAVAKFYELQKKGFSSGIGINIPNDIVFDDSKGIGSSIVVIDEEKKANFSIFGDSFINNINTETNSDTLKTRISAYEELYNKLTEQNIPTEYPQFVFEKKAELEKKLEGQNYVIHDETVSASEIEEEKLFVQRRIQQLKDELNNPDVNNPDDDQYLSETKRQIERLENMTDEDFKNLAAEKKEQQKKNKESHSRVVEQMIAEKQSREIPQEGELLSYNETYPTYSVVNKKTNEKTSIQPRGRLEENVKKLGKLSSLTEANNVIEKIKSSGFEILSTDGRVIIFNEDKYYDFDSGDSSYFNYTTNEFEYTKKSLSEWDFKKYIKGGLKITKQMKAFEKNEFKTVSKEKENEFEIEILSDEKTIETKPELKTYHTLKESDVKDLEIVSDEEFSDIVDSLILNDYKNIPNAIRLPNLNAELSEKLGLEKNSAFILKKSAVHIRPDRKNGYGQSFDTEEYREIPEVIRTANFAVVDNYFQNFQIVFDDKNNSEKINKIVFNKDELGNYLVTVGKVERESAFSEERNSVIAVGVAPTIQTLRTRASSTALRASATTDELNIAQESEKSSFRTFYEEINKKPYASLGRYMPTDDELKDYERRQNIKSWDSSELSEMADYARRQISIGDDSWQPSYMLYLIQNESAERAAEKSSVPVEKQNEQLSKKQMKPFEKNDFKIVSKDNIFENKIVNEEKTPVIYFNDLSPEQKEEVINGYRSADDQDMLTEWENVLRENLVQIKKDNPFISSFDIEKEISVAANPPSDEWISEYLQKNKVNFNTDFWQGIFAEMKANPELKTYHTLKESAVKDLEISSVSLEEILSVMEMKPEVTSEGKIKIYDQQRQEYIDNRSLFSDSDDDNWSFYNAAEIFERLDIYINDYFISDFEEQLEAGGVTLTGNETLKDLCDYAKEQLEAGIATVSQGELNLAMGIINPDTVIMPEGFIEQKQKKTKAIKHEIENDLIATFSEFKKSLQESFVIPQDVSNQNISEKEPFEIINNEVKGRVNIKFNKKIGTEMFNEIIKELKAKQWKYAPSTKLWYPVKIEGSKEFADRLFNQYKNILNNRIVEKNESLSTESVIKNIYNKETGYNISYENIKFFDRNYQEAEEFLNYFNKHLDEFGVDKKLLKSDAQCILQALNHHNAGTVESRTERLGLDENNNLILFTKKKEKVENKQINLKELITTAFKMSKDTVILAEEKLKEYAKRRENEQITGKYESIAGKEIDSIFENLYKTCRDDGKKVMQNMSRLYDVYIKQMDQKKMENNIKKTVSLKPLEIGNSIGKDVVSDIYQISKGVYQATLSREIDTGVFSAANYFVIDKNIADKLKPEITELMELYDNRYVIQTKRDEPYVLRALIEKKLMPPRDENFVSQLDSYIEKYPLKYAKLFPIDSFNFEKKLKELSVIDKDLKKNPLELGQKLISMTEDSKKERLSKWLKEQGCTDENKMKEIFSSWICEKTQQKENKVQSQKMKDNGYPPR